MTKDELLKKYSLYLRIDKRLSKKTEDVYLQVAREYLFFLNENNTELTESKVDDIEKFVSSKGFTSRSMAKYLSAIRSLYKFLTEQKIRSDNPSELLYPIKSGLYLPSVHSVEEIDKLINYISLSSDEYALRDRAIYELIYSSALRVSECINLKTGDYLKNERLIRINNSKRGKSRLVPVGSRAIEYIDEYLYSSRAKFAAKKGSDFLFLSRLGGALTRLEVWKRLDEYGEKVGIHFTVHSLRHSAATHILQNGANLVAVQAFLGHSDLKTTEIYTHLSNLDLKDAFFKYKK